MFAGQDGKIISVVSYAFAGQEARAQLTARVDYNNGFLDGGWADFDA